MTFTGLEIDKTRQGFVATMSTYIKRLTCLPATATLKEYRTLRAKLLWVAQARPDISAFVSMDGFVMEEALSLSMCRGSISTFSIYYRQVMCPCHYKSWMLNLFTWWSMPMLLTLIVRWKQSAWLSDLPE
jgi:hypothetical protein